MKSLRLVGLAVGVALVLGTLGFVLSPFGDGGASFVPVGDNDAVIDARAQVASVTVWESTRSMAPPAVVRRRLTVSRGDNLMKLLTAAGIDRTEAHAAITSLKGVYDPRRDLSVGDELTATFGPGRFGAGAQGGYRFTGLVLPVSYDREVAIERGNGGSFNAREVMRPLSRLFERADGTILASLYQDGVGAGIPVPVLVEMIRIYSFDVDFQRQIQPGDGFELMYERFVDDDGAVVHDGEVIYAKLSLGDVVLPLYRYETTKGTIDWFNAKGESVRKALMKTPLDGARLSSRFGKRKHPILGYTRMHAGADFAAPTGTPVYAAGNGSIEVIGRQGGYGKYVRIRHNSTYKTAYAHLSAFARGMTRGKRVRQGQVIGYVGSTGRSTGPHLHYEIHRNGRKINPLGLKLPSGEKLKGEELALFQAHRAELDRIYAGLGATVVAGDTVPAETGSCDPEATETC